MHMAPESFAHWLLHDGGSNTFCCSLLSHLLQWLTQDILQPFDVGWTELSFVLHCSVETKS